MLELSIGKPQVFTVPITQEDLCHPMSTRAPFTREGWIFELKHDGFRALAVGERQIAESSARA
jgi:hypothetical protein